MKNYNIPPKLEDLLARWQQQNCGYWSVASYEAVAKTLSLYQQQVPASNEIPHEIGLSAADILVGLRMDHESVVAALLLACEDFGELTVADITQDYDAAQVALVESVISFERFGALYQEGNNDNKRLEGLRKLFMSMAQDIRSVIVKIAYRLAQLRCAGYYSEERRNQLAQEIMDIYAPLANRLGIGQLKWEMEDLAFKALEPETYKKIAKALAEKRDEREVFIKLVTERVQTALNKADLPAKVYGRAKHIYSIWRKMKQKNLSFSELFDVRAVRITTDTIENCYRSMTVIHALWRDIPQEFDDYISHPKPNGYQSLHTAVIGPFGRAVEVQIRTERMHEHAERGVAAHWRYKEGGKGDPNLEKQIDWIREILEHKDASLSSEDLVDLFKAELTHERIYVITPKGDVMDLPKSATPLDFAYYIHTDIGHRCRGARVNGRIMPLTTELQSGDRVEVLTAKQAIPSRDWLQSHLGYLNTSRARSKARLWFREQNKQAATQAGKEAIEQSFRRLSLPFKEVDWNQLSVSFNYSNSDGLFAAFANDEISFNRLLNKVPKSITQSLAQEQQESHLESVLKIRPTQANTGEPVNIQGVGNLMVQMAQCCNPVPPDPIIGFITVSRGISIHKQGCSNLLNMESFHKERFINISWHTDREQQYTVNIRIIAISRSKLFYDISSLLSAEGVDIVSFNTAKDAADQTGMTIDMQVQVKDLLELNRLIEKLNQLSGILSVYRSHEKRPQTFI